PRVDVPHASKVATTRSRYCGSVVLVVLALREEEHILVCDGRAIPHRLGHGVRLVPDDVGTKEPACSLKLEGEPPRDADEVLGFEAIRGWWSHAHGANRMLLVGRSPGPPTRRVRIADVQPESAIGSGHTAHLL